MIVRSWCLALVLTALASGVAGCSCATSTLDGPCEVNGDCDRGQLCLDGRCQLIGDAAIADGGRFDVPASDTLPGNDTPPPPTAGATTA